MKVISPMPSKDCKRGSLAIARGHWQAVAGSPRGKPPDHGQFAAVLALVKDKPSATLKKRSLLTLAERDGDGDMRSERKNARVAGRTKD